MAKPAGTVQELVSYYSPKLQRGTQAGRIHRKPGKKELAERSYNERCGKNYQINNQQLFDHWCNLRETHPHLRSIAELRPKVCLSVISIVKAHNITLKQEFDFN